MRRQGKGAFVALPHASQRLERLEGLTEALAGNGHLVHSKRLDLKMVRATRDVAGELDVATGTRVTKLVSLHYLERMPLSVNTSHFVPALVERIARIDGNAPISASIHCGHEHRQLR